MKVCRELVLLAIVASFVGVPRAVAVPPVSDQSNNVYGITSRSSRYLPQRPTISPYLAMTSNTANLPLINYLTITRPLQQQQLMNRRTGQELQQLERQLQTEQQEIDLLGQPKIRSTGHRTGFMTQSPYFHSVRTAAPTTGVGSLGRTQAR